MTLLYAMELFGIVVFALSGALEAIRKRLDVFGVLVLAFISALGGGTLRDALLGVTPVSWMNTPLLAYLALLSGLITFLLAKYIRFPFRALLYADAIGLAAFTVSGTQIAIDHQLPGVIAVLLGIASAIFGGIIRDVIANDVPLIFRKDIYATAALMGALWLYFSHLLQYSSDLSSLIAFCLVLSIRVIAIRFQLSLPNFFSSQ